MKTPLHTLGLTVYAISNAMAHPGPVGHTHGDDWPFRLIAALAIAFISVYALKRFMFKKGQG